jgi:hypothetical protein
MYKYSFIFTVLASASAVAPAAAAPVPKPGPAEVTFTLDRKKYLPLEPVLAEVTLTNVSDRDILVLDGDWYPCSFEGADGDGKEVVLGPKGTVCRDFAMGPLTKLRSRESVRRWLDLSGWYTPSVGPGRYTVHAVNIVRFTYSDREHAELFNASSEKVSFEVVKPEGDDAEVVRKIIAARVKDLKPVEPAISPNESDPVRRQEAIRRALEETEKRREEECSAWRYDHDLCEAIAKQTKSARFRAAASLFAVLRFRDGEHGFDSPLDEAMQLLTACRESDGASPYLKGLAGYHLLLCKLEDQSDAARKEAKKRAEALIEDYPKTFMADKAREALDKLKAGEK